MTSISTELAAALLSPTHKLETGNALTTGLLGKPTSLDASLGVLNAAFGGATPANSSKGLSELDTFIKTSVANNEKLLLDLAAITALSSVVTSESRSPAIFGSLLKPFESALILGEEQLNSPSNIINTLI